MYDVNETIVIPTGSLLRIEEGTVLRFGAGRSLISDSPIIARGTEKEPILFTAQNRCFKWGVLSILSDGKSFFQYVKMEHARRALINGTGFPGSLSLIGGETEIVHCQFSDLYGRDAVYVHAGNVVITGSLFADAYKDGVDFDGGVGRISQSDFINCGDEAIDLPGVQDLEVFGNRILDSKGGRIAADTGLAQIRSRNTFGYSSTNRRKPLTLTGIWSAGEKSR